MFAVLPLAPRNDYPTTDGKPMAETDLHRDLMVALIQTLQYYYDAQPLVYVSGNLLLFYERGNKRRHVSPDVFVVRGVPNHRRENYLLWEERRGPEVVIELTSSSTRHADTHRKFALYRDRLKVKEYFMFDPRGDYLDPPIQGFRLRAGQYVPIRLVQNRLPSQVLGLHLEQAGQMLRLWDPAAQRWLPTPQERAEAEWERAEEESKRAEEQSKRAEEQSKRAEEQSKRADAAEAEAARLRHELVELRSRNGR